MRLYSRGSVVGNFFALTFVAVVMVSACQSSPSPSGSTIPSAATSVNSVEATVTVAVEEAVETEALTETVGLTETVDLTVTAEITEAAVLTDVVADIVTETVTITASGVVSITEPVTVTDVVSTSAELTATAEITPATTVTTDEAMLEAGLAVYRAQYCGVCHTLDAAETRGTFGPTHNGLAATVDGYFADGIYSGKATTPAEYLLESIVEPQAFIVPGFATTSHRMPSYTHLDSASLDALVVFLLAN